MNGNDNLRPIRSTGEARALGKVGGIKSGAARRRKRDLRLSLIALMDQQVDGQNGSERLAAALFKKALEGDIKAILLVNDLVQRGNGIEESAELGLIELP